MNLSCVNENVARIQHEIKLIRNELTEPMKITKKRKKYTKKAVNGYKTNEIRPTNRSAIPLPNDQNKMVKHNKMSFPQKIWDLAHQEDTDGFFQWSSNGQWITIERELFEELYLRNPYQQHNKSPIATENWPSFVRQLNLYGFRKVQPVYARGFTGSKPDSRINRKPFSNGKSRWVNYYNPLFHRDSCAVGVKVTRGASKVPKANQIQQSLEEPTDIEFVKRGPVVTDLSVGTRTFHDWNQRRGSTESHVSELSNADECPPLPPLPSMVTPDGLNHHGFLDHQNSMLPNPSCFPYFPVGQNINSFMKSLPSEYIFI